MTLWRNIAALLTAALSSTGCGASQPPQPPPAFLTPQVVGEQVTMPLKDAIEALPMVPERREGYARSKFRHWVDADRDGCDTRAEVLIDEGTPPLKVEGRCKVVSGGWTSWYDGVKTSVPGDLDIDHVVPLAEAWDSGAHGWDASRREAFANDLGDPQSLVAVSAASNRQKGDADPNEWLPPDKGVLCRYVVSWVSVKTRWHLSADEAERTKLAWLAQGCADAVVAVVDVAAPEG